MMFLVFEMSKHRIQFWIISKQIIEKYVCYLNYIKNSCVEDGLTIQLELL